MIGGRSGENETRRTQLLRGVLDTCLLALIAEQPRYGYELVEALSGRGLALVSEGSIYPLLSRLQRAGLVSSYHLPSTSGPPRKYYQLTPRGEVELASGRDTWTEFADAVGHVLRASPAPAVPRAGDGG